MKFKQIHTYYFKLLIDDNKALRQDDKELHIHIFSAENNVGNVF